MPVPADEFLCSSDERDIEPRLTALRETLGHECPSDYTFSNLYLFRQAHAYRLVRGPYPCITGSTYDKTSHALPLFDVARVDERVLTELIERHGCLFPVSAAAVRQLDACRFDWQALRDDADYLYRAQDLRILRGPRLRKKRAQINQLRAAHRLECRLLDRSTLDDALQVLAGWMSEKGKLPGQADHGACLAAFEPRWLSAHEGWIWYADDHPAGFLLTQSLTADVVIVRFAKGLAAYPGIFPLMFHEFARQTPAAWINFEQDLGVANFRQAKLAYAPAALLPKYRVALRPCSSGPRRGIA